MSSKAGRSREATTRQRALPLRRRAVRMSSACARSALCSWVLFARSRVSIRRSSPTTKSSDCALCYCTRCCAARQGPHRALQPRSADRRRSAARAKPRPRQTFSAFFLQRHCLPSVARILCTARLRTPATARPPRLGSNRTSQARLSLRKGVAGPSGHGRERRPRRRSATHRLFEDRDSRLLVGEPPQTFALPTFPGSSLAFSDLVGRLSAAALAPLPAARGSHRSDCPS